MTTHNPHSTQQVCSLLLLSMYTPRVNPTRTYLPHSMQQIYVQFLAMCNSWLCSQSGSQGLVVQLANTKIHCMLIGDTE